MNEILLEKLIVTEYNLHPKAELADYYKILYQEVFGPKHFVLNKNQVMNLIYNELEKATEFDKVNIQQLGQFYRINLKLIKKGKIALENLSDAFIKSAFLVTELDIDNFHFMWKEVINILKKKDIIATNEKKDYELIDCAFKKNNIPSLHHSNIYKKIYHPHYRLIHKDFIKNWRLEND